MTKQLPVGLNPRKILAIRDEHHQKYDPIRGQVMYLSVMVPEEILDELVDGHPESMAKKVNEDYDLIGIRGMDVLAKGTPVTRKLFQCQKSPTTRLLMSSSVAINTSHRELGTELHPPLLFEHISSSTELIVLVFLAMVFLGAIIVTTGSGI
jgi:hypothetical protein